MVNLRTSTLVLTLLLLASVMLAGLDAYSSPSTITEETTHVTNAGS